MEKSNLMMIVIIVLLVALLGTVVGVTIYAFNLVQNMEQAGARGDWDREPRHLTVDEINRVMVGSDIITNLATDGPGVGNVVRTQVVVGYDNTQGRESEDISQRIESNITFIRTAALESLSTRTSQELSTRHGREALAAELLLTLQEEFMTNMIVEVSFYEWIIQ